MQASYNLYTYDIDDCLHRVEFTEKSQLHNYSVTVRARELTNWSTALWSEETLLAVELIGMHLVV